MRVHPLTESIVLGNNRPYRTTDMGENVSPNWFFGFHSAGMGVFEEKTQKHYSAPHFQPKRLFIIVIRRTVPSKMVMPPKIIFPGYFGKYKLVYYQKKKSIVLFPAFPKISPSRRSSPSAPPRKLPSTYVVTAHCGDQSTFFAYLGKNKSILHFFLCS